MDLRHILTEPEAWVGVGLVLFFAILAFAKVPGLAARNLDGRSARIRDALADAERLRDEAKIVLEGLTRRRAELEGRAAAMLAEAEAEAKRLEADAKVKLEAQIARRTELADRRIALAETQAAAEVRAAAADLAVQAAETVFARRTAAMTSDPSVDRAVADLGVRLQ